MTEERKVRVCRVCHCPREKSHLCVRRVVEGGKGFGKLVISLAPTGVIVRQKGRRTIYTMSYGLLCQRAAEDFADDVARAKKAVRKARRKKGGR